MTNDISEFIPLSDSETRIWLMDSGMCQLSRIKSNGRIWLRKSLKPELRVYAQYRTMLRKEAEVGMMISKQ